ncbi:AraC family transcriptional regulator ligand-binding domain-containing protein [Thalassolituus sp. LLYu03]|uniref:AraC family transcriptional regulator ligand-binding domain-containing protein n=1 Tax=Thalassolituus sp. LLYu03 TaxID=3421656 RepID=UPI003D2D3663
MGLLANLQVSGDLAGLVRFYLQQQGRSQTDLYRYLSGLSAASRLSFRQWWDVLQAVEQLLPGRAVGVELGLCIRADFVGVLGHLLLSSETLADALQGFQRYQRLLHDGDRAEASFEGGLLCMSWTTEFGPSSRLSDEVLIIGLLTFVRNLVADGSLNPARVHFTFPKPQEVSALEAATGCEVLFNQARTAVYLKPEHLMRPVSQRNAGMHALLEQQAAAMVGVLPESDDFTLRLRSALLAAVQQGRPDAAFVASRLFMSERTLFRRLADAGFTFAEVMTQLRVQLARNYLLEGRLTQSEIALLLGYSEQSAFNRAFRQATGMPPARWLRSQSKMQS